MEKMINLEKFAGGALTEKFNLAFEEILENIADPNTSEKVKRELTLKLSFAPSEDRELSLVAIETKTKLAPAKPVATKILIDRDGKGGIAASEYNNQLKGQLHMTEDEETEELSSAELEKAGIKLVK